MQGSGIDDEEHGGGVARVGAFVEQGSCANPVGGGGAADSEEIGGQIHADCGEGLFVAGFEKFFADGAEEL